MPIDRGVTIAEIEPHEDVRTYIRRVQGSAHYPLYQQIIGAANPFKEGDAAIGVSAADDLSRARARTLLGHTTLQTLHDYPLYRDALQQLIWATTDSGVYDQIKDWTLNTLKSALLSQSETEIKHLMPGLNSDVIAAVTKLMSIADLTAVGQKVFNPLPGSCIGAKGYMGARIQPNSPTDHPDDVAWQVFNAFSFATGDVLIGTNPADSSESSIITLETTLKEIIETFSLTTVLPWCVLAHIDLQAAVGAAHPGSVSLLFQSLAGTDDANKTFGLTLDKMQQHAQSQTGQYGLYIETGQGADFTNGAAHGFDMVTHESRKYGFARALQLELQQVQPSGAWLHVNDVAGFIGPEVFTTREQLVRTALEDIVMGKLHGLCMGLDVCSTLHMAISLDDLDWALNQIMPANPAYLMALPTKSDPMLSYLTTAFQDHIRLREMFGYAVNDAMWAFYKRLGIIDATDQFTEHAGDPIWVYYQYCVTKGDQRSQAQIYAEGLQKIAEVQARGVPLAVGHGDRVAQLKPELEAHIHHLYTDAKAALWATWTPAFIRHMTPAKVLTTLASDREDYMLHPVHGEHLSPAAVTTLAQIRTSWGTDIPDVQLVISDGLNASAIMDTGHLIPYLKTVRDQLAQAGFMVNPEPLIIINGRVRVGYNIGKTLFAQTASPRPRAILHLIGERPGTGHHNYSVYVTAPTADGWALCPVDHDITRVISGISDTALAPSTAAAMTVRILQEMIQNSQSRLAAT